MFHVKQIDGLIGIITLNQAFLCDALKMNYSMLLRNPLISIGNIGFDAKL